MPDIGPDVENLCRETFDQWTELYYQSFIEAGIESGRALRLAKTVLTASEGAIILAKSNRDVSPLAEIAEEMAVLIRHALPS